MPILVKNLSLSTVTNVSSNSASTSACLCVSTGLPAYMSSLLSASLQGPFSLQVSLTSGGLCSSLAFAVSLSFSLARPVPSPENGVPPAAVVPHHNLRRTHGATKSRRQLRREEPVAHLSLPRAAQEELRTRARELRTQKYRRAHG